MPTELTHDALGAYAQCLVAHANWMPVAKNSNVRGDPAADDRGRQGLSGAIRAASPSTTAATTTLGQGSELATTPFEVDPSREGGTGEGAGSAMEMRGLSGAIFAALPSLHYYSPVPIY